MKKIFFVSLLLLAACTSPETEVKQSRDNVIRMHDRMMERSEMIVKSKMQVDTLLKNMALFKSTTMPGLDTTAEKAQLTKLGQNLQSADDRMSDWMSAFDPAQEGKSNEQKQQYFKAEQDKLTLLNRKFDTVLTQSGKYLQKFRKK